MVEVAAYALLTGVILGVLYGFFRVLRLTFSHDFIFDVLYSFVSAFMVFSYLLVFNDGRLRFPHIAMIAVGFVLYCVSIGHLFGRIEEKIAKKIKKRLKSFKKVLQSLNKLYYNIKEFRLVKNEVAILTEMLMMEKTADKLSIGKISLTKKTIIITFAVIILVGLFIGFGASVINDSADISRLENQRAEIAAKLDEQNKRNEEYQAVLENENKDDYIEQKAREKGYVKSDEIVFYDISGS